MNSNRVENLKKKESFYFQCIKSILHPIHTEPNHTEQEMCAMCCSILPSQRIY